MSGLIAWLNQGLTNVNAVLWHNNVLMFVLGVGVLFTIWSRFCQYRALTRGVRLVFGHGAKPSGPGAITHFQALSTALSATVGVGNIGGTALGIALGGPGAVFWMWIVGIFGMALKTTEVTLSMIHRNVDEPRTPKGGPMWVVRRAFAHRGPWLRSFGTVIATLFCLTLLMASFTGGNFFQAWNAANITQQYFGIPGLAVGVVLTLIVGVVIIGGITRIGAAAGRIVPFMCALYLLAAIYVIVAKVERVPELFHLILTSAFNPLEAQGAFLGATLGTAFSLGMQRSLFSNECGQGSSAIAHCAVRTDEPVREGVVAGLEPFIDTLVVCTLTALVILLSGAWNRAPDLPFAQEPIVVENEDAGWSLAPSEPGPRADRDWVSGDTVFVIVDVTDGPGSLSTPQQLGGTVRVENDRALVEWSTLAKPFVPASRSEGIYINYTGAALTAYAFDQATPGLGRWLVLVATWLFAISTLISWSYYGEQGVAFLTGRRGVLVYKIAFCLMILVASSGVVTSVVGLNNIANFGTGLMLFANIPITLMFAGQAMRAYHRYFRKSS